MACVATIAAAGFACLLTSQALAQDAPAPAQPPAAASPPSPRPRRQPRRRANPFMFSSDAAMLTFYIKADKAADFEKVMAKLHDALANSDKPERKQQAAGWKLYKASDAGPNGTVLYINFLSPIAQGRRLHDLEDPRRGLSRRKCSSCSRSIATRLPAWRARS